MYTSKIYLPIKCKVYLTKSMLQIWWNLTNSNEIYNTCTNNARAICFSDEISHLHLAELQSPVAVRKICWISLFLNGERKGGGKRSNILQSLTFFFLVEERKGGVKKRLCRVSSNFFWMKKVKGEKRRKRCAGSNLIVSGCRMKGWEKREKVGQGLILCSR